MKIDPKQKLKLNYFYNNIWIIVILFAILSLATSAILFFQINNTKTFNSLIEGSTYGPIVVTDKPQIIRINTMFHGQNQNTYISGEVQDEDRDTLYEFGKDLWHESGYDSEGYWSESDRSMIADLTFAQKGTYYIQFNTDENTMYNISIEVQNKNASEIPHLQMGAILILIVGIGFYLHNKKYVQQTFEEIK